MLVVQLGQGFGLFFLPGDRPRPRRGADSSRGSVFGVMMVSGGGSGSGSVGNGVVAGGSEICVSCMGTGGSGRLPLARGTVGTSSLGEGDGKVMGSSCSLSKTWGANSDAGSLPNSS